jgi:hypothetical protein
MLFIVTGSLGGGIGISCKDFGNKLIIEVQDREKKCLIFDVIFYKFSARPRPKRIIGLQDFSNPSGYQTVSHRKFQVTRLKCAALTHLDGQKSQRTNVFFKIVKVIWF